MYEAEVLADSITASGNRLTTIAVIYPHAVHKDMLRHRAHSRSVESFRARPTELLIDALEGGSYFVPDVFAKRVSGMQQGDALEREQGIRANQLWDRHVEHCLETARAMMELDIAKQQVNFVLQDLCPLVEIITATEWENFRALRTEVDSGTGQPKARPEVYRAAQAVLGELDTSEPLPIRTNAWHLPLVTFREIQVCRENLATWEYLAQVSAGRCARVSYDKHRDPETPQESFERAQKLLAAGHLSPFEHPAKPFSDIEEVAREHLRDEIRQMDYIPTRIKEQLIAQTRFCGNFRGWRQFRKEILNEDNYARLQAAVAS
jgi:hypothetical protein